MHLLGALPFAKLSWYGGCLNDLNAWIPNSVARSHLSIHLFNRTIECSVPIFLVHVVISSSALISQPNSIVFYLGGILLKNLINCQNLTIALLNFLELPQEIPKLGFGTNLVRSPKLHPVDPRMLIRFRRKGPPYHLVLVKLESNHFGDKRQAQEQLRRPYDGETRVYSFYIRLR